MNAAAEAPTVLLPYQVESIELAEEHQFLVVEKSRRIGLSYAFSPWANLMASVATGAQNVYYIGYNLDMAREFIGYCADFAQAFEDVRVSLPDEDRADSFVQRRFDGSYLDTAGKVLVDAADGDFRSDRVVQEARGGFLIKGDAGKSIKSFRIDFPSGKAVVALPSSPRSVRGKQGIFIIDEAAFHDNLEELIKAILAALMWGGRVIVISTHDGTDNYFNTLVEEIRAGKRGGHVHRITLTQRPPRWEGILCATVRRALGVEVFITACGDRTYVGRAPAAEIAAYAFAVLFRRLKAARADYIRTQLKRCGPARKRQRADIFCEGWAIAVFQKIAELMPEPQGDELIGQYLAERHPHLAPVGSRAAKLKGRVAGNDYWRGREAGHDVQLHMGVGGTAARLALPA